MISVISAIARDIYQLFLENCFGKYIWRLNDYRVHNLNQYDDSHAGNCGKLISIIKSKLHTAIQWLNVCIFAHHILGHGCKIVQILNHLFLFRNFYILFDTKTDHTVWLSWKLNFSSLDKNTHKPYVSLNSSLNSSQNVKNK